MGLLAPMMLSAGLLPLAALQAGATNPSRGESPTATGAETQTAYAVKETNVSIPGRPAVLALDNRTGEVFVTGEASDNLSVVSDRTDTVVATIPGFDRPVRMAYDFGRGEVFVTETGADRVAVLSETSNSVVARVAVGSEPVAAAYDPAKGEVFVANSGLGANDLSVISDRTNSLVGTVAVGRGPDGVLYDPARGELYVAEYAGSTVTVVNDSTDAVVGSIPVGTAPADLAYDSATGTVYVADAGSNTVSVINDTTNLVVANVSLPEPYGVAVDPGRAEVFVTNHGGNDLAGIWEPSDFSAGSAVVGANPWSVLFDGTAGDLFVANPGSNTVTVLPARAIGSAGTPSTYPIEFEQTGLPARLTWGVSTGAVAYEAVGPSMIVRWPNGTIPYSLFSPVAAGPGTQFTCRPAAGNLTVAGRAQTVPVAYSVQYSLTGLAQPPDGGTVTPSFGWYANGSSVSLSAAPAAGWVFRGWTGSGPGSVSGSQSPVTVRISGPVSETATFQQSAPPTALVVTAFQAAPGSVRVGQTVSFAVAASGGSPPLAYVYSGLPAGCSPVDRPRFSCVPRVEGSFIVRATVSDVSGHRASASTTLLVGAAGGGLLGPSPIPGLPAPIAYGAIVAVVAAAAGTAVWWRRSRRVGNRPGPSVPPDGG